MSSAGSCHSYSVAEILGGLPQLGEASLQSTISFDEMSSAVQQLSCGFQRLFDLYAFPIELCKGSPDTVNTVNILCSRIKIMDNLFLIRDIIDLSKLTCRTSLLTKKKRLLGMIIIICLRHMKPFTLEI